MKLYDPVALILRQKGSDVHSISPNVTVYEALERMADKDVGALVVMDGPDLVGVLSERDYARKVFIKGRSSKEMMVHEIMSSPAVTVNLAKGALAMARVRVIVKRLEEERKTAGGIVIPDTAAEKPSQGEIVFAGPGKTDDNGKLIPMGVKVGDKILFGKYSGQEFKLDGQDYLHMREDDVIGIIA